MNWGPAMLPAREKNELAERELGNLQNRGNVPAQYAAKTIADTIDLLV